MSETSVADDTQLKKMGGGEMVLTTNKKQQQENKGKVTARKKIYITVLTFLNFS